MQKHAEIDPSMAGVSDRPDTCARPTSCPGTAGASRRAELALKTGRVDEAIALAKAALNQDPSHVGLLETLAKAHWQAGQYAEVLLAVRRLVTVNPYEPGYQALKGAALQCMGQYGEAVRAYERAGDIPGARESLRELESWQADLVIELLRTDAVFKAHYSQNPADACMCRGFEFVTGEPHKPFLTTRAERAALFVRPS